MKGASQHLSSSLDYLDKECEQALPVREHLRAILDAVFRHRQETVAIRATRAVGSLNLLGCSRVGS